ncbi:hypothetical protein RFI_01050, partial [Reticulomyxa filosa]
EWDNKKDVGYVCKYIVKTLTDEYNEFAKKFEFYCESEQDMNNRIDEMLYYPNFILNDTLLLGTAKQAIDPKVVQNLNITHIVNVTENNNEQIKIINIFYLFKKNQKKKYFYLCIVFFLKKKKNIKYCHVKVEDKEHIDLTQYFDETYEFIC